VGKKIPFKMLNQPFTLEEAVAKIRNLAKKSEKVFFCANTLKIERIKEKPHNGRSMMF